jgi:hypothetical protein
LQGRDSTPEVAAAAGTPAATQAPQREIDPLPNRRMLILLRGLVIFPKPFAAMGIDLYTGLRLLKVKQGE